MARLQHPSGVFVRVSDEKAKRLKSSGYKAPSKGRGGSSSSKPTGDGQADDGKQPGDNKPAGDGTDQ